jgi:hypothetical protein
MWGTGKAPVRLTPPHLRRYGWLRLYNDFPIHPKWRVIARKARVPVAHVIGIAAFVLCKANVGDARGSLSDFSVLECAAALDLSIEDVDCVFSAMEAVGWIDQYYVSTWDERQPQEEDATHAERQRRYRAKKKSQRQLLQPELPYLNIVPDKIESDGVTRPSPVISDDQNRLVSKKKRLGEEEGRRLEPSPELIASLTKKGGRYA